jgi:hypothetical protein
MEWDAVKEHAQKWYGKTAHFLMFQGIVMYLLGCIVAHHPLGPTGFVGFLYHCFQWAGE